MEDKTRIGSAHRVLMQDRNRMEMTGIADVVSFDPGKVILKSGYGVMTIKGSDLHVNKLSLEKGEIDLEGKVDSIIYSDNSSMSKKGESLVGRLFG